MAERVDGGSVGFVFEGDTTSLDAAATSAAQQLDKVAKAGPKAGQAVNKGLSEATVASKKLAAGLPKAKKATDDFKKSADGAAASGGKIKLALDGVADVLDVVSPKFAEATRTIARMEGNSGLVTKALARMGGALPPVAVAVAALGAVYLVLNSRLEEAVARQDAAAKSATNAQKAYEDWTGAIGSAETALALATGEIDRFDVALEKQTTNLTKASKGQINATKTVIAQQERRLEGLKESARLLGRDREALEANSDAQRTAEIIIRKQRETLGALIARRDDTIDNLGFVAAAERAGTKAKTDSTDATKEATNAAKEQATAEAALADELNRLLVLEELASAGTKELSAIRSAATDDIVSDEDKILRASKSTFLQIDALRSEGSISAEAAAAARLDIEERLQRDLIAFDVERVATSSDLRQQEIDEILANAEISKAAAKSVLDANLEAADQIANIGGDVSSALTIISETLEEEGKKGAVAAFVAAKAAAASQLVISGIVSVARAFELGPIAGTAAAIGLVAAFAGFTAQLAASEPPKFHTGSARPDEFQATLQTGEAVITASARAALGLTDRGIERANAGILSQAGTGFQGVNLSVGGRTAERIVVSGMRGGEAKNVSRRAIQGTRVNPYSIR